MPPQVGEVDGVACHSKINCLQSYQGMSWDHGMVGGGSHAQVEHVSHRPLTAPSAEGMRHAGSNDA
jgi:hypothetical protein